MLVFNTQRAYVRGMRAFIVSVALFASPALAAPLYAASNAVPSTATDVAVSAAGECVAAAAARLEVSAEAPQDVATAAVETCNAEASRARQVFLQDDTIAESARLSTAGELAGMLHNRAVEAVIEIRACRKTPHCDPAAVQP